MEQIDMKLRLFSGKPLKADGFGDIAPLTVGKVIEFGYTEYMKCLNLITVELNDFDKENSEELAKEGVSVLDFLIAYGGEEIESQLERSLTLFLGGEAIVDKETLQVFVNKGDHALAVNRSNYANIQEVIKWQNYINNFEEKDDFNPANDEAKKFKEKMERLKRQREAAKKKKGDKDGEGEDIDFFDILSAISSKSYSINEINILDLTIYQVYRKFKRMQLIDEYDISIKSILAGARDVKIHHWSSKA